MPRILQPDEISLETEESPWETLLDEVSQEYLKLILIVGATGSGKSNLLKEISSFYNFAHINMGQELSQRLMLRPINLRAADAEEIAADIVAQAKGSRVAIDNTEVLFEYPLKLDPLRFLKTQSLQKTIVATWNGSMGKNEINYGFNSHPACQKFSFNEQDTFAIVTTPRF